MMIPSARVSCGKAKLPTTLMAVRAHPRLKLSFKSIVDIGSVADRELLEDPGEAEAGPWIILAHSRWMTGDGRSLTNGICGLSRKLGFLDSDKLTSTFLIGVALVSLRRQRDQKPKFSFFANKSQFSSSFLLAQRKALSRSPLPPHPLPPSLQCSPLILAVSATFAPRSTVLATSRTPSPAVSQATRNQFLPLQT